MNVPKDFDRVCTEWKEKKITAVETMKKLGLKKTAFYKLIKKFEGNSIFLVSYSNKI